MSGGGEGLCSRSTQTDQAKSKVINVSLFILKSGDFDDLDFKIVLKETGEESIVITYNDLFGVLGEDIDPVSITLSCDGVCKVYVLFCAVLSYHLVNKGAFDARTFVQILKQFQRNTVFCGGIPPEMIPSVPTCHSDELKTHVQPFPRHQAKNCSIYYKTDIEIAEKIGLCQNCQIFLQKLKNPLPSKTLASIDCTSPGPAVSNIPTTVCELEVKLEPVDEDSEENNWQLDSQHSSSTGTQQQVVTPPISSSKQQQVIAAQLSSSTQQQVVTPPISSSNQQRVIAAQLSSSTQQQVIAAQVTSSTQQQLVTPPISSSTQQHVSAAHHISSTGTKQHVVAVPFGSSTGTKQHVIAAPLSFSVGTQRHVIAASLSFSVGTQQHVIAALNSGDDKVVSMDVESSVDEGQIKENIKIEPTSDSELPTENYHEPSISSSQTDPSLVSDQKHELMDTLTEVDTRVEAHTKTEINTQTEVDTKTEKNTKTQIDTQTEMDIQTEVDTKTEMVTDEYSEVISHARYPYVAKISTVRKRKPKAGKKSPKTDPVVVKKKNEAGDRCMTSSASIIAKASSASIIAKAPSASVIAKASSVSNTVVTPASSKVVMTQTGELPTDVKPLTINADDISPSSKVVKMPLRNELLVMKPATGNTYDLLRIYKGQEKRPTTTDTVQLPPSTTNLVRMTLPRTIMSPMPNGTVRTQESNLDRITPPADTTGDRITPAAGTTGDRITPPADTTGDRITRPAGTTGDRITRPAGTTGDRITRPAGTTGDRITRPAGTTGDRITRPAGTTGDRITRPAGTTGDRITRPAGTTGDRITRPAGTTGDMTQISHAIRMQLTNKLNGLQSASLTNPMTLDVEAEPLYGQPQVPINGLQLLTSVLASDPSVTSTNGAEERSSVPASEREVDEVKLCAQSLIELANQRPAHLACIPTTVTDMKEDLVEEKEVKVQEVKGKKKSGGHAQCPVCFEFYSSETALLRHVRIHNVERPFSCPVCNKSFGQKITMKVHMRLHTGEKPHQCYICERSFAQKSNMETHVRRHLGLRPFKCDHCGKGFSDKGTLDEHVKTHTGDQPYLCVVCGKSFSQRSHMRTHMKRHHDNKTPYACKKCTKSFKNKESLKKHVESHE